MLNMLMAQLTLHGQFILASQQLERKSVSPEFCRYHAFIIFLEFLVQIFSEVDFFILFISVPYKSIMQMYTFFFVPMLTPEF